jgi:hypothetical protein
LTPAALQFSIFALAVCVLALGVVVILLMRRVERLEARKRPTVERPKARVVMWGLL